MSPCSMWDGGRAGPGAKIPFVCDHTIHALQGQIPERADTIDPGIDDKHSCLWLVFDILWSVLSIDHRVPSSWGSFDPGVIINSGLFYHSSIERPEP